MQIFSPRTALHTLTRASAPALVAALSCLFGASAAMAQTGVDDDRVSLPEGPGSLEGVGENVEIDPNMGSMRYSVPINAPRGLNGLTPAVGLNYSSSAPSGVLGVGWSMPTMTIERMTSRRTPEYVPDDYFAANGGEELVMVDSGNGTQVYRARFEGGFVRYTWHEVGDGEDGYWTAEYPDGSIGYFGADQNGDLVDSARSERPSGGTYKYHMVEKVDPYGHTLRYNYSEFDSNWPLVSSIEYVFDEEAGAPLYTIDFDYEKRQDKLSDAGAGYEELLEERLVGVRVVANSRIVREYRLDYEDYTASGGFSRLTSVKRYGLGGESDGELYPIVFSFGYSKALGVECQGANCDKPYLVNMGQAQGASGLSTGTATLLDINADGLPDILDTTEPTAHKILINTLTTSGSHTFAAPTSSAMGTGNNFGLGNNITQVIDVNGDGLSDLINTQSGATILAGYGKTDWSETGSISTDVLINVDASQAKFLDYNNDKRIDLMTSDGASTIVYENLGSEFKAKTVENIGVPLAADSQTIQLSDMNGDGYNDVVEIQGDGSLRYKLNYGWGKWSGWRGTSGVQVQTSERELVDLEDLNGDGITDVVVVTASQVKYAINRNGDTFDDFVTITSADIDGDLPEREETDKILYADMNGNGSEDVVWFDAAGQVQYLELFPTRPNLLSRIENGIGSVQKIDYTTSAIQEAAAREAGDPWTKSLSIPMNIVASMDTYVTLTGSDDGSGLHEEVNYTYRDGFYDGVEKQFRGFERVEIETAMSDAQEGGVTVRVYDLGQEKPHMNGKLLTEVVASGGRTLQEATRVYEDCDLDNVPAPSALESLGRFGVYFPCETRIETVLKEGQDSAAWKTLRETMDYDGWGNVIKSSSWGVIDVDGDELFEETTYYYPGENDRWFVGLPLETSTYAVEGGSIRTSVKTYYDGEPFVGSQDAITHGFVSRVTEVVDAGEVITRSRSRADAHGNIVETIDPNGSIDVVDSHRREYVYDRLGLFLTYLDIHIDAERTLRRSTTYEPYFQQLTDVTDWVLIQDGEEVSPRNERRYEYDDFGRQSMLFEAGDDADKPSVQYEYELGEPFSRILVRGRTERNGPQDEVIYKCFDGKGREYQMRSKMEDGGYLVSGFSVFNSRGAKVETYQPYSSTDDACEVTPPAGVKATRALFDTRFRVLEMSEPGEDLFGEALISRTEYLPLQLVDYDPEDLDPSSPHHDTPTITYMDGVGRKAAMERVLATGEKARYELFYDETGSFSGYSDPAGNRHELVVDLAGRTVAVRDASTGEQTYTYDGAGNVLSSTDARGVTTRYAYDGGNRLIEVWDDADREGTLISYHYDTRPQACDLTECTNTANRLAQISFPTPFGPGLEHIGYDARQRVVFQGRSFGDALDLTVQTRYDNMNRPIEVVHQDGTTLKTRYDEGGRPTRVDGFIDALSYDSRGQLASIAYSNGATSQFNYDALQRLEARINKDATGAIIEGVVMDRDRMGNILTIEDMTESGDMTHDGSFVYDAWYRVTSAAQKTRGEDETITYGFDLLDRVTEVSSSLKAESAAHVGQLQYDAERPLTLTQAGEAALEYDAAGQMIKRGDLELTWDHMARITSASKRGESEQHVYGADKARIAILGEDRTVFYGFGNFEVRDGVSSAYVRPNGDRLAKSVSTELMTAIFGDEDEDGEWSAADVWLRVNASAEGATLTTQHELGAVAARILAEARDEKVFFHADSTSSIVSATDEGGEVVGRRVFSPTGVVRQEIGHVDVYGFTGQEYNDFTDLIQFKMRDLDPRLGRWASFDPAFAKLDPAAMASVGEATTGYAYVAGNYMNSVDPNGLAGSENKAGNGNKNKQNQAQNKPNGGNTAGAQGEADVTIVIDNKKNAGGANAPGGGGGEGQQGERGGEVGGEGEGGNEGQPANIGAGDTAGGGGGGANGNDIQQLLGGATPGGPAPPQPAAAQAPAAQPGAAGAPAAFAGAGAGGGGGAQIQPSNSQIIAVGVGQGGGGGGQAPREKYWTKQRTQNAILGVGLLAVVVTAIVLAVTE